MSLTDESINELYKLVAEVNKRLMYSKIYIDDSKAITPDNIVITFEIVLGFDKEKIHTDRLINRYVQDLVEAINKNYSLFKAIGSVD